MQIHCTSMEESQHLNKQNLQNKNDSLVLKNMIRVCLYPDAASCEILKHFVSIKSQVLSRNWTGSTRNSISAPKNIIGRGQLQYGTPLAKRVNSTAPLLQI